MLGAARAALFSPSAGVARAHGALVSPPLARPCKGARRCGWIPPGAVTIHCGQQGGQQGVPCLDPLSAVDAAGHVCAWQDGRQAQQV